MPTAPKNIKPVEKAKPKAGDGVDWKKVDTLVASGVDQEEAIKQARK